MNCLITIPVTV